MAQTTLSLLGASLGFSGAAIGAVAAGANLISVLIMVLVTARLATSSARPAVFVGLLLMAASVIGFLVPAPAALLVGAVFLGLAGGLVLPAVATAVADRVAAGPNPSRAARGRALALLAVVLSISLALGPAYESAVLAVAHERLLWGYAAFLPIVVIGAVVARGGWPAGSDHATATVSLLGSLAGLGTLFRNRRWLLALCGEAIYMMPFSLVIVFAGLLGTSLYPATASFVQFGLAGYFLVSFGCRATLARRPAVAHRVALFWLCVGTAVGGLGVLAVGGHLWLFLVALAMLGVSHGLGYPLALGLVSDSVPLAELPHANAVFQAVTSMISVVMPVVFGVVLTYAGDRGVLLAAAVPLVPLALGLWRLRDAG